MDLTGLVMRDGVRARARGRVLLIDGTVWFEPPSTRTLALTFPSPPPHKGRYALPAHGVDLDRLDQFEQHDGGILGGWTTLTATWRRRELYVHDQNSTPPPDGRTHRWTTPPCPPPAEGWPTVPIYGPMSTANLPARPPRPDEWAELTITQITQFHPHATQPVLVVTAEEPERVEQALRPTFGAALCVVPSRYHRHEVDQTLHRLREEMLSHRWPMTSNGRSASDDGQPTVTARFAWIEPEVAEWAETVPDGLLDLDVWLKPVS